MSKVKKNISLEEDILAKGLVRAKELGYNFSTYVTYLINQDSIGLEIKTVPKKEKIENDYDEELLKEVDNIIDF